MGLQHSNLKQLCWKCKHSCDVDECIWVRTLKKRYKGTLLDDEGYIIFCPKYQKDELLYSDKERADLIGIPLGKYRIIKRYIKVNKLNMSVGEYLEFQKEKNEELKNRTDEEKKFLRRLWNARSYIKRKGLNISPEEYIEIQDNKRELRKNPNYLRNCQKLRYKRKAISKYSNG